MPGDRGDRARRGDGSDASEAGGGHRAGEACCDGGLDPGFAARALDAAPIGIIVTDPSLEDNPIVYANEGFRRVTGYGNEEILGRNCRFLQGEGTAPEPVSAMRAAVEAAEPVTVELRNYRRDGSAFWNRVSITPLFDDEGDLAYFVGCQEVVTDRVERERMLSGLHAAVPSLMRAESVRAVGELATRTPLDVSGLSFACLYRFDGGSATLRPIAHAATGGEIEEPPPVSDLGDPIRRTYDDRDRSASARTLPLDGPLEGGLAAPIGDHGVIVAGGGDARSSVDREFVELLASAVEASLDRLDREGELERRNERLVTLSRLNRVIRGVNRAVAAAGTRAEIERAVCGHLAETSPFRASFVVSTPDRSGGARVLESVGADAPTAGSTTTDTPWVRAATSAIRTGAVVTRDADDRAVGPFAAIPLLAGEATYGALVAYTEPAEAFDDEAVGVLSELGETIGLSIRAVETRHSLLAETAAELSLAIDGDDSALAAVADRLGHPLSVEGFVPIGSEGLLCAVSAHDDSPDALETIAETDGWELLTGSDDRGVLAADAATSSFVGLLLDHGVVPHSATAEDGRLVLVAHAPPETELRPLVDELGTISPSVELVGRREVDRPVRSVRHRQETFVERLTDRQLNALRAAYLAGYFEWPRDTTAEELAGTMGVSSSTFHFHLRRGLQKLLGEALEPPEWRGSR